MKFFVLLLVLLFAVWLFRHRNPSLGRPNQKRSPEGKVEPMPMVACLHCGVHLAQGEAVQGARGVYCSSEHLQLAGDRLRHG
jgi:uncharacterized protein